MTWRFIIGTDSGETIHNARRLANVAADQVLTFRAPSAASSRLKIF